MRLRSVAYEREWQACEFERMRGTGPFRHVANTVETTRQVEGGHTQLATSA